LTKSWVARASILNTRGSKQDSYQQFADIKGLIRSRKSKKDNTLAENKKDKRTNNDLQNITQKTKDRATRTPLKIGCELMCLGMVSSSSSTCEIRRVAVRQHKHNLIWKSFWTPAYVNRYNINKTFQCHIRFIYSINAYLHKLVVYCSSVQWIREHQLDILTMKVLTIDIHHHTGNELCRCSCMLYD
jgi:hypothetical protein